MSRIMTIWLPRWPVQRRLLERPELRRRPVFVCRRERRGVMTVVAWAWAVPPRAPMAASRRSAVPRIPAGMSLAEAMAVLSLTYGSRGCHVAEVDHDDPAADRAALEELARSCRRFAPLVAIEAAASPHEGPECLHIDVTGTSGFFGGEHTLVRTAVWTLAARGIHARAAIADTPAAAWAAAHHTDSLQAADPRGRAAGRHRRVAVVPPGGQIPSLAGLPAAALRLDAAVTAQLQDVGIETIGGVARLPRKSLASRFSPQLLQRLAEFTGERAEPLVVPCSGELPTAAETFDFPLLLRDTLLDDLIAVIERLLQACVAPLAAEGKGVMALQVRLERGASVEALVEGREACAPAVIDIGVFQPTASARHLAELVRLRMARMRLPREIEGIVVEVVSAGAAECRQRTLFGEATGASASQVAMLMDRLAGRLGRGAVFEPKPVADAQPEHAWAAVPPMARAVRSRARPVRDQRPIWATARSAAHQRPIWLLPMPLRLEAVSVVDAVDATAGPPVRFRLTAASASRIDSDRWAGIGTQPHDVVRAHGPERIETAWWRGPTVRRDYYVVETSSGNRYWIFRRLRGGAAGRAEGEWFVHGVFC